MEKRQEGEDHFLARLEGRERGLAHRLRRDQVVVRQHHALRVAGGAAGVGQGGKVGPGIDGHRGRLRRVFRQQILQPVHARGHLGLLAEQPLESRQILTDVGDHREIQLDAGLRDLLVEDVLADGDARAAVLDLVAHLVAGVDRADRRDGGAALQRREIGDDELRAVEQIKRHPVALLHAEVRQCVRQAVGGLAQLAVADRAAVEHHRGVAGRLVRGFVERLRHRLQRHLDGGRHALAVVREPGPRQVNLGCAHCSSCRRF